MPLFLNLIMASDKSSIVSKDPIPEIEQNNNSIIVFYRPPPPASGSSITSSTLTVATDKPSFEKLTYNPGALGSPNTFTYELSKNIHSESKVTSQGSKSETNYDSSSNSIINFIASKKVIDNNLCGAHQEIIKFAYKKLDSIPRSKTT